MKRFPIHLRCRDCQKSWVVNLSWFSVNFCLSLINIIITSAWVFGSHDVHSIPRETPFQSPILKHLHLPTFTKQVEGSLFPPPNPSIGRAFPNPESDAIWDEIELTRTVVIRGTDVKRLGKDPNTSAKFEGDYWEFGDDAFMGQIDAFHQLHCLNSLRKLGYPEYYFNETGTKDEMWYVHHNHCVDILLQNLMCTANVDIITLNWMETQNHPFPDFSINHQCRDFETLLNWRKENSVDMEKWNNMVKPQGVTEIPAPKEYYELFGKEGMSKDEGNSKHHT